MKEFTDEKVVTEVEQATVSNETVAQAGLPELPVSGMYRRLRQSMRQLSKPHYRNPYLAAALQIMPGAGYIYLARWGSAILTAFLFGLAYVVLGLHFLVYTPFALQALATPVTPDPEPDLWNWSLLTPESILLVLGILALLILNVAGRTFRLAQRNNLNLQVKSIDELRRARGTWLDTLLYFNYLAVVVIVLGMTLVVKDTEVDPSRLFAKFGNILRYVGGLLNPAWDALWTPKGIMYQTRQTLEVSIIGSLGGSILAVPLSLLAARNLMGRNPITNVAYYIVRIILSIVRAVPTLFLAIIFVASVGIGAFPAVLAITIFSAGLMTKLFSEAIEAIDWGQVEAVSATGGSPAHLVLFAVIPQVVPYFISHMLYSWEVSVHSASVLGLVGAGGIGQYLNEAIENYFYSKAGMALLVVIVITMTIDFTSAYIRARII